MAAGDLSISMIGLWGSPGSRRAVVVTPARAIRCAYASPSSRNGSCSAVTTRAGGRPARSSVRNGLTRGSLQSRWSATHRWNRAPAGRFPSGSHANIRSCHHEKVEPVVERSDLSGYIEQGLTQRQIANRCGCSQTTVRYWLRFHGLRTRYRSGRESSPEVLAGRRVAASDIVKRCRTHGEVRFVLDAQGFYRCAKCRSEGVKRRRRIKEILVSENGGCCVICGYDRSIAALHFHHVDPEQKRFSVAEAGTSMPIERLRDEVGKCVLLCSNCHVEVEGGIAHLPID
jgi:hypothetical protein